MIILILLILNNVNLYLIPWFISIKIIEGKAIYVQFALSVQKGHIKYNVAPKVAYRPQHFVMNFGVDMCVDIKQIL